METAFALIFEEFSAELNALTNMVVTPTESEGHTQPAKARIAAGNAATLLLAAVFEEYVRQLVKAAFREKSNCAKGIQDFPKDIAANVWRLTLQNLARVNIEDVEANPQDYEARLAAIVAFSLKKDISSDVAEALAHNENNMRPQQLTQLFNQIGVKKIMHKSCEDQDMLAYLGSDNTDHAYQHLAAALNDFFKRRNYIAHAIQLNNSSGPVQLNKDIQLFFTFGRALQRALDREFSLAPATSPVALQANAAINKMAETEGAG
jgi:hypothetical protein